MKQLIYNEVNPSTIAYHLELARSNKMVRIMSTAHYLAYEVANNTWHRYEAASFLPFMYFDLLDRGIYLTDYIDPNHKLSVSFDWREYVPGAQGPKISFEEVNTNE